MNSNIVSIIITVVLAHFLALLSPGPDFVLIVKSGIRNKRQNAVGVALGIALANGLYIILCLIGVGAILAQSIIIMTGIKICGGVFLLYLSIMALKAKKKDYDFLKDQTVVSVKERTTFLKEFITGFTSAILNPKNPIFYLSLFSLVLNNEVNIIIKICLGIWMTTLVFVWDAFIIFVLSRKKIKSLFSRVSFYIDKITGSILGLIGVRLIQSAVFKEK